MQSRPPPIETPRLQLTVLMPDVIGALISGDTMRAGALAGVVFPVRWPEDPEACAGLPWHLGHLEGDRRQLGWRVRVIVETVARRVVGSINLKGPPDSSGDVELGWGVDAPYRLRGYAVEAAAAVAEWATAQAGVTSLTATIADENIPSRRVAMRLAMHRTSETRRDLPLWRRATT